jgi:hypothetical protein
MPRWTTEGWVFTGRAENLNPDGKLEDVRSFGRQNRIFQGYCFERDGFKSLLLKFGYFRKFLKHWLEIDRQIERARASEAPLLMWVAKEAYLHALETQRLEFRLPELVRVAEVVLALPMKKGADVFACRALQIVPELAQDPYVKTSTLSLGERLEQLYWHRSSCVHGKVPFAELHDQGERGKDEAALFEYVADALARACVLFAFNREDYSVFSERKMLESAWSNGELPRIGQPPPYRGLFAEHEKEPYDALSGS